MVTEASLYLRRIDSYITQLEDQGPLRTCNESREGERSFTPDRVGAPPWRQPKGKSLVNISRMSFHHGVICMGVGSSNHQFAPGLPLWWLCGFGHARDRFRAKDGTTQKVSTPCAFKERHVALPVPCMPYRSISPIRKRPSP